MATLFEARSDESVGPRNDKSGAVVVRHGVDLAVVERLEGIVAACNMQSLAAAGSIHRALTVAAGMQQLEELLTDQVMQPIMRLANSRLGFVTDRDPARTDRETGKPCVPYALPVVRRCFIESLFMGLYPTGNEWNVIAESCYAALNGLRRKVREFPGLVGLLLVPGVPELRGDTAIVKTTATWRLHTQPCELTREIPVRVNRGMGFDAILGKAERKMLAAIWQALTGSAIAEGDATEPALLGGPRPEIAGPRNDKAAAQPGPVSAETLSGGGAVKGEPWKVLVARFEALKPPVTKAQLEAYLRQDAAKFSDADVEQLRRMYARLQAGARWEDISRG